MEIPEVVRNKAVAAGVGAWVEELPALIDSLAAEWNLTVGEPYHEGTEAFVAPAETGAGEPAVLKVLIPHDRSNVAAEITVLERANGVGCARLLRHDIDRAALLIERLGPSLHQHGFAVARRHAILADTAARIWQPAPDCGLSTGAAKARWLREHIVNGWDELDRPCSERAIDHAVAAADRRAAAHNDERAVIVHGDVHEWNALRSGDGWKLVDPDGHLAEPEYDLGIIMREDPAELVAASDPRERSRFLAARTGLNEAAIWDWGVIERVSTGLVATRIGLQPVGQLMLAAADALALAVPAD